MVSVIGAGTPWAATGGIPRCALRCCWAPLGACCSPNHAHFAPTRFTEALQAVEVECRQPWGTKVPESSVGIFSLPAALPAAKLAHPPLALVPGGGLAPFRLGQSLPDVLALVRARAHTFRLVEVKYAAAQQGPPAGQPPDIAVCFPEHGFHLLFDGRQQRLRLVEVHDTTRLQLRFGGHAFGGAAMPPAFGRVCEVFGPAYPGEPQDGQYPLQYPGILFLFPLSPDAQQPQHGQRGGDLPVPLHTPAARILVHHGSAATLAAARAAPPPPPRRGSPCRQAVEAVPGQGLLLPGGQLLRFGDSPQDVVSELGEPCSSHARLARPASPIPSGGGAPLAPATVAPPDYYLCYARLGLDTLFCGASHRLKRLVLHANLPGHPDFGLYAKCHFRVHPPGSCSLPAAGGGEGGEGGSAASDGGASMQTAASEASQAATEGGGGQAGAPGGGCSPRCARHDPGQQVGQQQVGRQQEALASELSAARDLLAGLADGGAHSEGPAANGASLAQPLQPGGTAATMPAHGGGEPPPAALGRPPRPPTSHPISAPALGSRSGKKKGKRERQRAAAAARLPGHGGGGDGLDHDTDTDASFADSAPSSLASSPGMTSFLSHIAATGGAPPHAPAPTPGPAPASGYSSDGSGGGFAGKELRLENGSAFDGWSEGDDLALLVGDEAQAGGAAAAPAPNPPAGPPAGEPQQQRQAAPPARVRVSTAVQTALSAPGDGSLPASAPDSPDSFVLADSPELFDEVGGAAEYETVPRQRSSGTQTQGHLLRGPPLRGPAAGGAAALRPGDGAHGPPVGVDGCLADIQAAFGRGTKPALHTRLGGRHPFGPTHLYAFRGAVFEVLRTGGIATLTLFEA